MDALDTRTDLPDPPAADANANANADAEALETAAPPARTDASEEIPAPVSLDTAAVAVPQVVQAPAVEPVGAWKRMGREIVAGVQTLLSAAVYATLIVTFGFQVARVDGLSMAPTLEDHDRLIVNKLVYELGEPRPGDIVMLYYPLNPEKMFVKRVIAKEGDTVRIVDGRVYVNDVPLRDDYVPAEFRSHDDWGPQVVQQGYYFVMGDHRNNSSDSRHWGPVPKKYIVGKVKVRWWPLQDARIF
jgi:signal peptidase I